MAKKAKLSRFGRTYDSFLSEASNEEIVSISKELTDVMSSQVKLVNSSALALVAISLGSMIFSVMVISSLTGTLTGTTKAIVFLLRILAVALTCAASVLAAVAIMKMMKASSVSTIFWRNVRQTADDAKVFEQMNSVRALNYIIGTAKNNVKSSVMFLVGGGFCLGLAYLYQLLVMGGYI